MLQAARHSESQIFADRFNRRRCRFFQASIEHALAGPAEPGIHLGQNAAGNGGRRLAVQHGFQLLYVCCRKAHRLKVKNPPDENFVLCRVSGMEAPAEAKYSSVVEWRRRPAQPAAILIGSA